MGVDRTDLVAVAECCETYICMTGKDLSLAERLLTLE
jgi:hypothetical protein